MKRVIKFRGKIDSNWWYVTPGDDAWEQFWAIVDRETVGQFIGVIDARREEIYEGDILAHDQLGHEVVGVIERFYAKWIIRKAESVNLTTSSNLFVVVGNVHEHLELLRSRGHASGTHLSGTPLGGENGKEGSDNL